MSTVVTPKPSVRSSAAARPRPSKPRAACPACEGNGYVTGAHFGAFGMISEDGEPVLIPCIVCDGTGSTDAA